LGEEPAGLLHMDPEAGQIFLAYIRPDCRRRGLGIQLLGQAVQYARTKGRERLVLRCPETLRGYFARYGFISAGEEMAMDLRRVVREIPAMEEPPCRRS